MYEKFLTQTKKETVQETVFDRIHMDQLYREQKLVFLKTVEDMG